MIIILTLGRRLYVNHAYVTCTGSGRNIFHRNSLRTVKTYGYKYENKINTYKSVPITTEDTSSNPAHGQVYSIQQYVIKFVSDLRQVGGFFWILRFPPPVKLTSTI